MSIQSLLPTLEQLSGQTLGDCNVSSLGGGDINAAYRLTSSNIDWFIKVNRPSLAFMFAAEADGLAELAASNTLRIPQVIAAGNSDQYSFLALEYIPLGRLSGQSSRDFGHQLATLHQQQQKFFGWHRDNTIGSTDQINDQHDDWVSFWRDMRLLKQLEIAAGNGYAGNLQRQGEHLADRLAHFFTDYQPHPSLLHGDLWGGNAAADDNSNPVIYDPACYYGDREADIAMTELFGGFSADFYAAYNDTWPLDSGYSIRKTFYNLYHILNHLNLFGSSYLHQAQGMIERLLAEVH